MISDFSSTWTIPSEDDLQTIDLEVDDMKGPINADGEFNWRIVDGDGKVMAYANTKFGWGDLPADMVTEVERLLSVEVPDKIQSVAEGWGDDAQDAIEDAGGDKEKAQNELRKRNRAKREERRKRRGRG